MCAAMLSHCDKLHGIDSGFGRDGKAQPGDWGIAARIAAMLWA